MSSRYVNRSTNDELDELAANPSTVLKDDGKPVNPELENAIKEAFLGATESLANDSELQAPPADKPVNDLSTRVKRKKH